MADSAVMAETKAAAPPPTAIADKEPSETRSIPVNHTTAAEGSPPDASTDHHGTGDPVPNDSSSTAAVAVAASTKKAPDEPERSSPSEAAVPGKEPGDEEDEHRAPPDGGNDGDGGHGSEGATDTAQRGAGAKRAPASTQSAESRNDKAKTPTPTAAPAMTREAPVKRVPDVVQHLRDNFGPLSTSLEPYVFRYGLVNQSIEEMYFSFKNHVSSIVKSLAGNDDYRTFRLQMKTMLTEILADALGEQAETFAGCIASFTSPDELFRCLVDGDELSAWVDYVLQFLYNQPQQQQQQRAYGGPMNQSGGRADSHPADRTDEPPPHQDYHQVRNTFPATTTGAAQPPSEPASNYRGGVGGGQANATAGNRHADPTGSSGNKTYGSTHDASSPPESATQPSHSATPSLRPGYSPPSELPGSTSDDSRVPSTTASGPGLRSPSNLSAGTGGAGRSNARGVDPAAGQVAAPPSDYGSPMGGGGAGDPPRTGSPSGYPTAHNNNNSIPRPLSMQPMQERSGGTGPQPSENSSGVMYPSGGYQPPMQQQQQQHHHHQQQRSPLSADSRPRQTSQWSSPQYANSPLSAQQQQQQQHQHQHQHQHQQQPPQQQYPQQQLGMSASSTMNAAANSTVSVGQSSRNSSPSPMSTPQSVVAPSGPQPMGNGPRPPPPSQGAPRQSFIPPHHQHQAVPGMGPFTGVANARSGMGAPMRPTSISTGPTNSGGGVGVGMALPLPASSHLPPQQTSMSPPGMMGGSGMPPSPAGRNPNIPVPLSVQQQQMQLRQQQQQHQHQQQQQQQPYPLQQQQHHHQQQQPPPPMQNMPPPQGRLPYNAGPGMHHSMLHQISSPVLRTTFPPPPAQQQPQQQQQQQQQQPQQQQPQQPFSTTQMPLPQQYHQPQPQPQHQQQQIRQQQQQQSMPPPQHQQHQSYGNMRLPAPQPPQQTLGTPNPEGAQPQPDGNWVSPNLSVTSPLSAGSYQGRPSASSQMGVSGGSEPRATPKSATTSATFPADGPQKPFAAKMPIHHHHHHHHHVPSPGMQQQQFPSSSKASPLAGPSSVIASPLPAGSLPQSVHQQSAVLPVAPQQAQPPYTAPQQPSPTQHPSYAYSRDQQQQQQQQSYDNTMVGRMGQIPTQLQPSQTRGPAAIDSEADDIAPSRPTTSLSSHPGSRVPVMHHHHHQQQHMQQQQPLPQQPHQQHPGLGEMQPSPALGMQTAPSPLPGARPIGGHMQQPSTFPQQQPPAEAAAAPSASSAAERTVVDEELCAVLRGASFKEESVTTVAQMGYTVRQLHDMGFQGLEKIMRKSLPTVMLRQALWKALNERISQTELEEKQTKQQKQQEDLRNFMQKNSITTAGHEVSAAGSPPPSTLPLAPQSPVQASSSLSSRPALQLPQPRTKQQAQSPTQSTPRNMAGSVGGNAGSPMTEMSYSSSDMEGNRRGASARSTPSGTYRNRADDASEDFRDEDRSARRGQGRRGAGPPIALGGRGVAGSYGNGGRGGTGLNGGEPNTRGGGSGRGGGGAGSMAHQQSSASGSMEESQQVCKFFLKPEGCQYGDHCRFLHRAH